MQPAGHLTIEYDAQSTKLVWRWHPALNTHEQKWTLRIPGRQFHQVLADFYAAWHDILQQLRFHAPLYPASQNLLKRRLELTGHLLPDSLDLASLAQPGDLITVNVAPDCIPVEVLDAAGDPFVVRYRTLHTKLDEDTPAPPPTRSTNTPAIPIAQITLMNNVLGGEPDPLIAHQQTIRTLLADAFGHLHVNCHRNGAGNLTCQRMLEICCDPDLACHYHMGHGIAGHLGGLLLADRSLHPQTLRAASRATPLPGGFAFLNSCWSASTGLTPGPDITRSLLHAGRTTVLAAILPPIDLAAADFASEFFSALPGNSFDLLETFHQAVNNSWNRSSASPDSAELSWACYRLYGLPKRRFLRTRLTEDNGLVVWRNPDAPLVLGSLDPDSCHTPPSISPQQFARIAELALPSHTHADFADPRRFFQAIDSDQTLRPLAHVWLRQAIAQPGTTRLKRQLLGQHFWKLIAFLRQTRPELQAADTLRLAGAILPQALSDYLASATDDTDDHQTLAYPPLDPDETAIRMIARAIHAATERAALDTTADLVSHLILDPLDDALADFLIAWDAARRGNIAQTRYRDAIDIIIAAAQLPAPTLAHAPPSR